MFGHKLVVDAPGAYTLQHPDGSQFQIAKGPLSAPMHALIAKMPKVQHDADGTQPDDADTTIPNFGLGGGDEMGSNTPASTGVPQGVKEAYAAMTKNSADPYVAPAPIDPNLTPAADVAALGANTPDPAPPASVGVTPPGSYDPQAAPPAPGSNVYDAYINSVTGAIGQAEGANTAKAAAEGRASDSQYAAAQAYQQQVADEAKTYQTNHDAMVARGDALYQQVATGKIDPNHMWSTASTGSKLAMLAGILVSGAGANAGQGNAAMNVINKAIDTDIDAQKTNLNSKQNLLNYNLQQTRDVEAAHAQTRLDLMNTFKGQLDTAAAKQGSAIAKANAAGINASLDMQKAGIIQQTAVRKAQMATANQANQPAQPVAPTGIDPKVIQSKMQPWLKDFPGQVPEGQQAEVMDQVGQFNQLQKDLGTQREQMQIMRDNAPLIRSPIAALASDAQRKYDAAGGVLREMATRAIASRVTEFSADNIGDSLPTWKDAHDPTLFNTKVNLMSDAMKTTAAEKAKGFGTLQRFGIVSNNDPIITPSATNASRWTKKSQ